MAPSASLHHSFAGRRVLVTGAASGFGRAIVQKFYDDGAVVFALDRNAQLLSVLQKELPKIKTICMDLQNWDETKRAVEALAPLDHLVNNAGIALVDKLHTSSQALFDETIGVNLKAVLSVSQAFVKGIVDHKKADGGTIVNISSIADSAWNFPGFGVYCASKGAVTMLTKSMASEFAVLNNHIRVNCICPGVVNTPLVTDIIPEFLEPAYKKMEGRTIINHRELLPNDIANGVLFLSSPLAEMITGTSLTIDSGFRAT